MFGYNCFGTLQHWRGRAKIKTIYLEKVEMRNPVVPLVRRAKLPKGVVCVSDRVTPIKKRYMPGFGACRLLYMHSTLSYFLNHVVSVAHPNLNPNRAQFDGVNKPKLPQIY